MNPQLTSAADKLRRFGPYVLLQLTGAGGMGRVDVAFSARGGGVERLCVLKRMHPEMRYPEQITRFRREASIACGLSHGAIAQTLDVEEIEGELCILQEFVHGANVAQLEHRAATRQPLPISVSVHVLKEVARALAYAHAKGIVHRDVAPDNIMLSFTGEVKLIDFGIAKPVGDRSLTQAGLVIGRPIYTAPEVVVGGEATRSSDVYSLGVVLWQMLTGRAFPDPFEHGPAPGPVLANSLVPAALDRLCMRAIALAPEDRFGTADELLSALTAAVGGRDVLTDRLLGDFLGRHFDVAEERRQLAADMATARHLLQGSLDSPPSRTVLMPERESKRPVRGALKWWTGGALSALVVGIGAWASWSRLPRAAAQRERAVHQAPRVAGGTAKPDLVSEALSLFRAGSFDRALRVAQKANRAGPAPDAHLVIGKVLMARQDLDRAAVHFREASRLRPDDPEPRRFLELLRQTGRARGY